MRDTRLCSIRELIKLCFDRIKTINLDSASLCGSGVAVKRSPGCDITIAMQRTPCKQQFEKTLLTNVQVVLVAMVILVFVHVFVYVIKNKWLLSVVFLGPLKLLTITYEKK